MKPVRSHLAIAMAMTLGLSVAAPAHAQTVRDDLFLVDGKVHAIERIGNTIYVGGEFNYVGHATGGLVALDATTGTRLPFPKVVGSVYAIAADGAGGWFIGGRFTEVGGVPRTNLAHIAADLTVSGWSPEPGGVDPTVLELIAYGSTVWIRGNFTQIAGALRYEIAALDATTGALVPGSPNMNTQLGSLSTSRLKSMVLIGSRLAVGGNFPSGDVPRQHLAIFDAATGALDPANLALNGEVTALASSGSVLYMAGSFGTVAGVSRSGEAAVTIPALSVTAWDPVGTGCASKLSVDGSAVYISCHPNSTAPVRALDAVTGAELPWNPGVSRCLDIHGAGSVVYVGGDFSTAGGVQRNNIAALDAATAQALAWNPDANGAVHIIRKSGNTILLGGDFFSVPRHFRQNIAALDAITGAVTDWNPGASQTVRALHHSGPNLFVGGDFTTIASEDRAFAASFDHATGALTSWNPGPLSSVRAIVAAEGTVYLGGTFVQVGGQNRRRLAAVDAESGELTDWNPGANGAVYALALDGTRVFVGGAFTSIHVANRQHLAAVSRATGLPTSWTPNPNGEVHAVLRAGESVFAGGDFTHVTTQPRRSAARWNAATGQLDGWNPNVPGTVYSIAPGIGELYLGGSFAEVGGVSRTNFAAVNEASGAVLPWAPVATATLRSVKTWNGALHAGGDFKKFGGEDQWGIASVDIPTLVAVEPPHAPALSLRAFPNPSRGAVHFELALEREQRVEVSIHDLQGRRVARIADAVFPAGIARWSWERRSATTPAGLYFARVEIGGRWHTARFVVSD